MADRINTRPIEGLLRQCAGLRQSGQAEMKINRKQAGDLENSLATLTNKLVELQDEIIHLQRLVIEAQTVTVEFDGGEFSSGQ
jgi:hypothetical protein